MKLTDDEREALIEYVEDAVVFAIGAWAEREIGVRVDIAPTRVAAEFIAARNPVEIEALLADRLAAHEAREARVRALADRWEREERTHREASMRNADIERAWIADSYMVREGELRIALDGPTA